MILRAHEHDRRAGSALVAFATVIAFVAFTLPSVQAQTPPIPVGFGKTLLIGETSAFPTSLQFGPDGRLYVAQFNGLIKVYDVARQGPNSYRASATQTINSIQAIPNHDDDGSPNSSLTTRLVTGLVVAGTALNPIVYVTSSDPRIGGGASGSDLNLDTNSGVISRLSWNGSSWEKLDLVRGLPRSEENHTANGMALDPSTNMLYVAQGGNTNKGAPSHNFAELPEVALSAAVLSVNLNAIGNTTYSLPTLDDEARPGQPDAGDPFGGNDGNNQARLVPGGPVGVYSPGYRNPYDVLITQAGRMYTIDNGANGGWGDKPIGEGPGGTCTNGLSEPGSADPDHLHLISGSGYYGGHPNPTRANVANTFNPSNPQSPVTVGNPIECDYRAPTSAADGNLTTFLGSTDGLAEFTASNFGGALTGDVIAAGYSKNTIYRVEMSSDGTAAVANETLFSTVGTNPLDVTSPGPAGPFPGTIWVADGDGAIRVFEPNDYDGGQSSCTGADNPALDEDQDRFDNADEIDNSTNPCSSADVPADWDGDFTSNLNDPDDDNDGRPDTSDPFAIDPNDGLTTNLPVSYGWENDDPNPGGVLGLGFTGLMTNGTSNYESLFDADQMTAGGAAGVTTVESVPGGDAYGTGNNQSYAFQVGVAPPATGLFTAHTRIEAPFSGVIPTNSQSMGMFVGPGNQNNYVKIVTAASNGTGVQFMKEVADSVALLRKKALALPGPDFVDLYLTVDATNATVQPSYSVTSGGVAGIRTNVGNLVAIPTSWLSAGLGVGIISTSRGPGAPFPATWDLLEVLSGDGQAPPPGHWQTRPPSGPVRQEVSYVNVENRLYLAGGGTAQESYDPSTDAWTDVAPFPANLNHIQAVEVDDLIYYIGGLAGWPSPHVNTVYIYDPSTNTFSEGAPMPRGRGAGGVAVHGGKIYYAGGLHDGTAVAWFDEYDPATDSWTQLPDMPRARDHFHAAVVDDRFYAIGGRNTAINATTAANDSYDFTTGSWSAANAPLPTQRGGFAAAVLGREVLIIGGEGGGKTFNTVEAYDVSTDRWRTLAPMPTARHGIQAAVCNGGVYIAGGGKTQGGANPTDVHEVFFLGAPSACSPTGPPPPPTSAEIARDPFDRSVTGGWGSAPVGGSWSIIKGESSNFSVGGSQGSITALPAAPHSIAVLSATDQRDVTYNATIGFTNTFTGSGRVNADLVLRRQGGAHYRVGVYLDARSHVWLRGQNSAAVTVLPAVDTGIVYSVGDHLLLKVEVQGINPTSIKAKVWKLGSPEPGPWTATSTDSTATLQSFGSVGVRAINTTGTEIGVRFDDLVATRIG